MLSATQQRLERGARVLHAFRPDTSLGQLRQMLGRAGPDWRVGSLLPAAITIGEFLAAADRLAATPPADTDNPAGVIHTVLHIAPGDATVSNVYRHRHDAIHAALNAAEAHAAALRRADSAFLHCPVADDLYDTIVEDFRSWAILSVRHRPTGEPGSAWRWVIQQHEVIDALDHGATPAPALGAPAANA
jgi:hypothetical protein